MKIQIEEIPVECIEEFWEIHLRYLIDDGIITDEEDIEYFQSADRLPCPGYDPQNKARRRWENL